MIFGSRIQGVQILTVEFQKKQLLCSARTTQLDEERPESNTEVPYGKFSSYWAVVLNRKSTISVLCYPGGNTVSLNSIR